VSLLPEDAAHFVAAAAEGDRAAWERLVDAYGGLIWAITRNHRLRPGDAADVSQTTWLRLLENIDRLHDPARVGAWLATTARRECLRLSARRRRTVLVGDEGELENDPLRAQPPDVDDALLLAERDDALRGAFDCLQPRCRELLRLMLLDPAPSYEEISAALAMPIGSIGPTRGRCLDKLRLLVKTSGIESASARSL
jgi:RNA polymerase sigma factor (sigma-70 family)